MHIAGVTITLDATDTSELSDDETIAEKTFTGCSNGLNLQLTHLLKELLQEEPLHLEDIIPISFLPNIVLEDVYANYTGKTKQTDLIALPSFEGKEIQLLFHYQAADKTNNKPSLFAFGISADFDSLGNLPLVGSEMKNVKLQGVGFIYTSTAGKFVMPETSGSNGSRKINLSSDAKDYTKGLNLKGKLSLPIKTDALALSMPLTTSTDTTTLTNNSPTTKKIDDGTKWFSIDKKIGPVSVNQIGFKLANKGEVSLLLNGAVTLAGLTLSVEGLGVSFNLFNLISKKDADSHFKLSGLGLAFEKKPLVISGMFLRADPQNGEEISFYGSAQISTSKFSIVGIGGYSKMKDGNVSFFMYAAYNGPLGGPVFFYVTGVAAGFGYNRKVKLPKLEEVTDHPLVSMVLHADAKKTVNDVLSDLVTNDWIPTSPGDYWLAIGVKFTSFKIIESFVLLTVQFGTQLEFAILCLSLLKWPSEGKAIVYIELAVLARFGPGSDVIAVKAMITPNSYVLDKSCKLTGGFAFYSWISGQHEGDFVITLVGYHPSFKVPDHYPTVDRLSLSWRFSSVLSIYGEMYFALTPKAVMAGGRWEVEYNLSFLSASVTIWADMIIFWAPFHYEINAGIIVRIEANIKISFIYIHFKLQMGCELHVWGPPFAGEIYVDWTIFSFTIGFGDTKKKPLLPIPWTTANDIDGFVQSFIPIKEGDLHPLDTRFIAGVSGQLKDANGKLKTTFVNPYSLVIGVDSFFPLVTIETDLFNAGTTMQTLDAATTLMQIMGDDNPTWLSNRNNEFGLRPMCINNTITKLSISLQRGGADTSAKIRVLTTAKGMAGSLWANLDNETSVVKNLLSGIQIHPLEDVHNIPIESIDLDHGFYAYESFDAPNTAFMIPRDAEGKEDLSIIEKNIKEQIHDNNGTAAASLLMSLGFDLQELQPIVYDELQLTTPYFEASIGQKIMNKIKQ